MSEDKTGVSAAPTPETATIMKMVREMDGAHGEKYFALKGAVECGIENLERERDEARRGFERMSDTCFAAIRHAEKAEEELYAVKEQLVAEKKLSAAISRDCNDTANERNQLRSELAAAKEQLAAERKRADMPTGYCVVPLEPEEWRIQAAWDIQTCFNPQAIKAMYKAMIKARK